MIRHTKTDWQLARKRMKSFTRIHYNTKLPCMRNRCSLKMISKRKRRRDSLSLLRSMSKVLLRLLYSDRDRRQAQEWLI